MWDDPVVKEVRKIRQQLAAECGYDLHRMLQQDREVVREWKGKVVTKEALRGSRAQDVPVPPPQ